MVRSMPEQSTAATNHHRGRRCCVKGMLNFPPLGNAETSMVRSNFECRFIRSEPQWKSYADLSSGYESAWSSKITSSMSPVFGLASLISSCHCPELPPRGSKSKQNFVKKMTFFGGNVMVPLDSKAQAICGPNAIRQASTPFNIISTKAISLTREP